MNYLVFVESSPLFTIGYNWLSENRKKLTLEPISKRSIKADHICGNFKHKIYYAEQVIWPC